MYTAGLSIHFGGSVAEATFDTCASIPRARAATIAARTRATSPAGHASSVLAFDQRINLPKGDIYLFLVVLDTTSNRFGAINLPVAVQKPSK